MNEFRVGTVFFDGYFLRQAVQVDGATELEAIADGREAFIATVSAMVDTGQDVPVPVFNGEGLSEHGIVRGESEQYHA